MAKTFRATEQGYRNKLIAEGEKFEADDDFEASWAVEIDKDGNPVSRDSEDQDAIDAIESEPSKQEDITAAIEPVLPAVKEGEGDHPLPLFHPTAATEQDKVARAVEAATVGGAPGEEVITTATNPSATPAKKSAAKKSGDKDGNDLV